jgi:hypothetical protein
MRTETVQRIECTFYIKDGYLVTPYVKNSGFPRRDVLDITYFNEVRHGYRSTDQAQPQPAGGQLCVPPPEGSVPFCAFDANREKRFCTCVVLHFGQMVSPGLT